MSTSQLLFLDTETTGLTPGRHEVIDLWGQLRSMEPPFELLGEAGGLVQPTRLQLAALACGRSGR